MGKMHIYDDPIQNYIPLPQPFDELFTITADQIGLSYSFSCCNLGSAKCQLEGQKTLNAGSEGGVLTWIWWASSLLGLQSIIRMCDPRKNLEREANEQHINLKNF